MSISCPIRIVGSFGSFFELVLPVIQDPTMAATIPNDLLRYPLKTIIPAVCLFPSEYVFHRWSTTIYCVDLRACHFHACTVPVVKAQPPPLRLVHSILAMRTMSPWLRSIIHCSNLPVSRIPFMEHPQGQEPSERHSGLRTC